MYSFILHFTITLTCLTFVSSADIDETKEDQIHDKIAIISHSIDVNLRKISEQLNKESLSLAERFDGLTPEDKKTGVKKYLGTKVDEVLNDVADEVRELVALSGSRERSLNAAAKHLGADHMRILVSAAGGLFPWQDETAHALSQFTINYLYHQFDQ